jgi:hypothetical protein
MRVALQNGPKWLNIKRRAWLATQSKKEEFSEQYQRRFFNILCAGAQQVSGFRNRCGNGNPKL